MENHNNNKISSRVAVEQAAPTSTKEEKRKQLVSDFSSGVTLHGFRFLFEGHPIQRLIWFTLTSASFLYSFYLFQGLVGDFLTRKTIISKSRVRKDPLDFPTIRFCMMNRLSKTKMRNAILTAGEIGGSEAISKEKLDLLAKDNVTTFLGILKKYQLTFKDVTDTTVSLFNELRKTI